MEVEVERVTTKGEQGGKKKEVLDSFTKTDSSRKDVESTSASLARFHEGFTTCCVTFPLIYCVRKPMGLLTPARTI